jgi:RNA polymerase sigma factor (sigma-70 family)
MHVDDMDLVREFAASGSEAAFAALVHRHVNLVYSAALRRLGNAAEAEEVAQIVFTILARKACSLRRGTILSGWLYQTAQLTAANHQRAAIRRQHREQEAFMQFGEQSEPDASWHRLSPLLEEAMTRLGQKDRDAIVLRFFENRTVREVAAVLGLREDAAQKRVNRATDRLRKYFVRRGIQVSAVALLTAIGANAVKAAPVELASKIAGGAALKGALGGGSVLTLKTTLKIMAWTKAKTAIVTGAAVILAIGMTTSIIAVHHQRTAVSKAKLTEAGQGAYGLYVHFGSATFANPGEKGTIPASRFAPASLNVPSWAHAAKQAGMTFAVLTAKHESGFCLWDSQNYSYDVGSSPFKGDIIGDFITACKAEGIAPGVHYSIPDEFNEGAVRYNGAVSRTYFDLIKKHVTELHTLYPGLRLQIFDMSERLSQEQFDELRETVKQLNPQCIVWGTAPGQSPNHDSDTVIPTWMWTPNSHLNAAQSLSQHHQRSQAAGKAFVLNIGPDRAGEIPESQLAVLMQVK